MAAPRRKRPIGQRRRVEDEGEDEAGHEGLELDDASLSDGSIATDDRDAADDSDDTSNIDEASPVSPPDARTAAKGAADKPQQQHSQLTVEADASKPLSDTELMLHGMSMAEHAAPAQDMHFDDVAPLPAKSPDAPPIVVSSASAVQEPPGNRRRMEHEDYKKRRDEDPAFVPNRGAFFMHDHRHAGPAANGFRPFGRGRGRGGGGGGRGGFPGPFAPINHMHRPGDPTTSDIWRHDMHEVAAAPTIPRRPRQMVQDEGPPNGNGFIPTCEPTDEPINRTLSTEKHLGNTQVRVFFAQMKAPAVFTGRPVKQYTRLPDHRPPLRRDKPVRISLPNNAPRYIFPAADRSFIFIPRAMRPNQQRMRGKSRSAGGYSRRTSVFGGSYYGSVYSPSVAASRRSSFAQDRDYMFSPAGSVVSRQPLADASRPVVRLPPGGPRADGLVPPTAADAVAQLTRSAAIQDGTMMQPQMRPLPQKPVFPETRTASVPMQQPRPQKNISVADIESPAMNHGPLPFQQAFHQQVPVNGMLPEQHARQPSYPSHLSVGTPLSQIPERAIHAAPFRPHAFGSQPFYNHNPYPPQGYYYGQGYQGPAAPAFAASGPGNFVPQQQGPSQADLAGSNLVAQEANGMVYYYDPNQLPPVNNYPSYAPPQGFPMNGMVTPSPDGYYYPPGMVYYPQ